MTPDTVDDLLEQLARGEIEVLGELLDAYAPYLRAVVRNQLADRLRAKFDSADVVQSVWVQVMRRIGREGLKVNDKDHLRALLVTIARRRLISRARSHTHVEEASATDACCTLTDTRHAAPGEDAQANDLWAKMLRLTPPEHHLLLRLKREGLPLIEIAQRTGLHEGSVRRILRQLSRELALQEMPLRDPLDAGDAA